MNPIKCWQDWRARKRAKREAAAQERLRYVTPREVQERISPTTGEASDSLLESLSAWAQVASVPDVADVADVTDTPSVDSSPDSSPSAEVSTDSPNNFDF